LICDICGAEIIEKHEMMDPNVLHVCCYCIEYINHPELNPKKSKCLNKGFTKVVKRLAKDKLAIRKAHVLYAIAFKKGKIEIKPNFFQRLRTKIHNKWFYITTRNKNFGDEEEEDEDDDAWEDEDDDAWEDEDDDAIKKFPNLKNIHSLLINCYSLEKLIKLF
jgi:hypothetical protein